MYPDNIISFFTAWTGKSPKVVVRAPGRINLIGEHTDYNEGFVLPAAIDKAVYFAVSPRADNRLEFYAFDLQESHSGDVHHLVRSGKGWPDYLLGVLDEARKAGHELGGLDVVFGGDIPSGSGLSSSAAVENGMLYAANEVFNWNIPRMEMVKLAQRGENHFVGMNCGIMDMFASMMGRTHHAIQLDCRSLEYNYFPFESPEYQLILCNSGVKHTLVDSEYNTRRTESETGVRLLQAAYPDIQSLRDLTPGMLHQEKGLLPELIFKRCKHVVEENERVLQACSALQAGDWSTFGALLYQSHEGLQHEYEVTCVETDFLVDFTRTEPSVAGSRQMGGGFGGCTLNLVRKEALEGFLERITHAYQQAFGIRLVSHVVELTDGVGSIQV